MKHNVKLYGCSFTDNFTALDAIPLFDVLNCDVVNYGKESSSNSQIYKKFLETVNDGDIVVLQWSALTRPMDSSFVKLKTSDNPLYDLLEDWYGVLDKVQELKKEKNLNIIQYIGWAQWKDEELNDYHRTKLKSYDITWFKSPKCLDVIQSNCMQFSDPAWWAPFTDTDGIYEWSELIWGGMSEWIRSYVEIPKRYMGKDLGQETVNPHPSQFATHCFVNDVLIELIKYKIYEKEIDFFTNSYKIGNLNHTQNPDEFVQSFLNAVKKYDKITLLHQSEVIYDLDWFDFIVDLIEKHPKNEIFFAQATSTYHPYSLNPCVNLCGWRNHDQRKGLSWHEKINIKLFDKERHTNDINKNNKGIISVRKKTQQRDYIFSKIKKEEFTGIFRYARWPDSIMKEKIDMVDNAPTYDKLIKEYRDSYVSFVIESTAGELFSPLTEKTIIPMLTKTMPIIYSNNKGYIKELNDMGLFTFNHLFGFDDGDDYPYGSKSRMNLFVKCIENYNKMTEWDITELYHKYAAQINQNYDIMYRFVI